MTIRLNKPFRGNTALAPSNYGRAQTSLPAQQELNHTIARANAQYLEALSVDGVGIQYWRRTLEGRFCTCHAPRNKPFAAEPVIDDKTNDDNGEDELLFKVRGGRDVKQKANKTEKHLGATLGALPNDDDGQTEFEKRFDESWDDLESQADDDAYLRMGVDAAILFGGERNQCGICFGTGRVNGYALMCGKREIFDASDTHPTRSHGFRLDLDTKPHVFEAPNDPALHVEWDWEIPTFFDAVSAITIRNNTKRAPFLDLTFCTRTDSTFRPLTVDALNALRGTGGILTVRCQPARSQLTGLVRFTHIEIVLQTAAWPKAQMPAISESTNFGVWDNVITTEFTLPPTLNRVDKEDVIFDHKHHILWKVTDYTDFMTAQRQICGWTASVRFIQQFEQLSLLRLSHEPAYELSYGRMEPVQGRKTRGDDGL